VGVVYSKPKNPKTIFQATNTALKRQNSAFRFAFDALSHRGKNKVALNFESCYGNPLKGTLQK